MSTPLQQKRRRNKEFEQICGRPSKYVLPHDAPAPHPVSYLLEQLCPSTPVIQEGRDAA